MESTYVIDFERLYARGYRGLIFDIDNTLVPHGAPIDARARKLFARLRAIGFSYIFISNNKEERVKPFADAANGPFISKAGKPGRKNYLAACEVMGLSCARTAFVGDQLFTDVYGAKRSGIYNILVKPINKKEEIQIVLKRYLEKIVLHFFRRNHPERIGRV